MALRDLSRHEILRAVAEYDRLGQDRFLEKYGFGAARSYRLVVDGRTYDSKAIVGHTITGPVDERLAEVADGLGVTKGDLLLMTRLVLFVEGEHDVIILSEMFGSELRDAGIRVFPAHGGDNFAELAVTKPGLVGGEIIGALGIRMAVVLDTSPTRVEPTVNRMVREAEAAGRQVTAVRLRGRYPLLPGRGNLPEARSPLPRLA